MGKKEKFQKQLRTLPLKRAQKIMNTTQTAHRTISQSLKNDVTGDFNRDFLAMV